MLKDKDARGAKDLVECNKQIKSQEILAEIKVLKLQENDTTVEIFKQIWLAIELDQDIAISIEDPATLLMRAEVKRQALETEEETVEPAGGKVGAGKGSPAKLPANKVGVAVENASPGAEQDKGSDDEGSDDKEDSDDEEYIDTEEEERRFEERERAERAEEKRLTRLKWRKRFLGCAMKACCFKDEEDVFDEEENLPSCKQVCCWRFLRARRTANRFHTSVKSLEAFEKAKNQACISILLIFNYLMLYCVALAPFALIFMRAEGSEALEELSEEVVVPEAPVEELCEGEPCPTAEDEFMAMFNNIMLLVNAAVLFY